MTIRSKLRTLLLAATLIPLFTCSMLFGVILLGLGTHLAEDTKKYLVEQSHGYLRAMMKDADQLIQKDFQLIDWILVSQKNEIEQRIASRANDTTIQNLESLIPVFLQLREKIPGLVVRQYLILPSGRSYVLSENSSQIIRSDLIEEKWFNWDIANQTLFRSLVKGPQNKSLHLLIGIPLYVDEGLPRGMTAVEVSLNNLFFPLRLHENWHKGVKFILARGQSQGEQIKIVAESSTGMDWDYPGKASGLESALADVSKIIASGVKNHLPDVVVVSHSDQIRHWAYGDTLWDGFFPLIMFEHEQIVTIALETKQHILGKIRLGTLVVGLCLLIFSCFAVLAAWRYSMTVTEPARKLSNAFDQLSKGDFSARVTIDTRDEIEELGHNFNELGEKLEDRNRMANSLAMAREVQQNLLPHRPPDIEGVEVFFRGIPCDETGGDYYDFIEHSQQESNLLSVVVGDVTGHGIPAALLMASARGILRSHVSYHSEDLSHLFQQLNYHLVNDSAHEQFMTLFYAILDRQKRTLCWNSAGHGPVLLYRAQTQTLVDLEVTGPPLGIDASLQYNPQTVDNLDPGDILLAGTDGLWECRNQNGDLLGIDKFKHVFLQISSGSANEIGRFLFNEIKVFQGSQGQEDDMSLVIAKIV